MNDEMKVAYIRAQTVSAECELVSMVLANILAMKDDKEIPHKSEDFENIPVRFGITHNNVIGYFTGR